MMTAQEAADYCGLSVNSLKVHVPVPPVKFGSSVRYDRQALDAYLDRLSNPNPSPRRFSEVAGNESGARDRT